MRSLIIEEREKIELVKEIFEGKEVKGMSRIKLGMEQTNLNPEVCLLPDGKK